MKLILSVNADLDVCLTNDNQMVIMVNDGQGEHLAFVPDMDDLIRRLREADLIRAENLPSGMTSTAEAELTRRLSL